MALKVYHILARMNHLYALILRFPQINLLRLSKDWDQLYKNKEVYHLERFAFHLENNSILEMFEALLNFSRNIKELLEISM